MSKSRFGRGRPGARFRGKLSCRLAGESRLERLGAEAPFILEGDWTLVTRNSVDFRGHADNPGASGQFADVPLHAGLVCINGPDGMNVEVQCELFEAVLDEIGDAQQMVNEVIEVDLESLDDEFTIHRYPMPEEIG